MKLANMTIDDQRHQDRIYIHKLIINVRSLLCYDYDDNCC